MRYVALLGLIVLLAGGCRTDFRHFDYASDLSAADLAFLESKADLEPADRREVMVKAAAKASEESAAAAAVAVDWSKKTGTGTTKDRRAAAHEAAVNAADAAEQAAAAAALAKTAVESYGIPAGKEIHSAKSWKYILPLEIRYQSADVAPPQPPAWESGFAVSDDRYYLLGLASGSDDATFDREGLNEGWTSGTSILFGLLSSKRGEEFHRGPPSIWMEKDGRPLRGRPERVLVPTSSFSLAWGALGLSNSGDRTTVTILWIPFSSE